MNLIEKKLSELVRRMNERGHIKSVKAEFEAEGTRSDELLRLLDVTRRCNIPLTLKIGGCEAVKDLYEARQFGARYIVAPMIESQYALSKYCDTIAKVYPDDEADDIDFLFNLETIQAYQSFHDILPYACNSPRLSGIVFGRTDFSGSLGKAGDVQCGKVTTVAIDIARHLSRTQLDFVIGGAISITSLPELRIISEYRLTRFETRKIVFSGSCLTDPDLKESLLDAVHFEILWLINKSNYYGALQKEDRARIDLLEKRWNVLKRDIVI